LNGLTVTAVLDYIPFAPHNVSSSISAVAAAHLCAAVSFAQEHRHRKGMFPSSEGSKRAEGEAAAMGQNLAGFFQERDPARFRESQ